MSYYGTVIHPLCRLCTWCLQTRLQALHCLLLVLLLVNNHRVDIKQLLSVENKAPDLFSHRCPFFYPADKSTDYQNYYQGLWDCERDLPDELSFKRGDAIYILSKVRLDEFYLSESLGFRLQHV